MGNILVIVVVTNTVQGTDDNIAMETEGESVSREFKHLKRFDGKPGGQSVEEFLARVEALARIRRWSHEEKAAQLLDLTTDRAFQLLSNVPRVDEDHYERLVSELRNAYGLTMDKAIGLLATRRAIGLLATRRLKKGESVYDHASDLRNYTLICLLAFTEADRSRVAAVHFWRGLHQSEALKHLFGT